MDRVVPSVLRASDYRQSHARPMPILVDHDWAVGEIVHLERSASDGLVGAGTIKSDVVDLFADGDWWFSPAVRAVPSGQPFGFEHAVIKHMALTRTPASVNTRAIRLAPFDITVDDGFGPVGLKPSYHDTLHRAHVLSSSYAYQRSAEITVLDVEHIGPARLSA